MNKNYRGLLSILFFSFSLYQCTPDSFFPANPASKITGTWHCTETSEIFGTLKYDVSISRTGNEQEVTIANFYQLGSTRKALLSIDGQNIVIPEQTVNGNIISGGGSIASDLGEIDLSYQVDDQSGQIDHVTTVLER